MTYKSAQALEMAVKEAAKASSFDTGRAISGFYFHRLLCRVFAGGNSAFVLKGGQCLLARTVDARMTRDIDLLSTRGSLDYALEELVGLAQTDLGDFVFFEFEGARPIKAGDEYRSGVSVRFTPMVGIRRMQSVTVDLVVDEVPFEGVESITPADRIEVDGVKTCEYLVYPVECALADKLCALFERHDGRPSSRVKDLVDIAVYATTCSVNSIKLQGRIQKEANIRGIVLPNEFVIPAGWEASHARQFGKLCSQTGLADSYRTIDVALELAHALFEPALSSLSDELVWTPAELGWKKI